MKPLQTLSQVIHLESAKHWLQERDPLAATHEPVARARLYARIVEAVARRDLAIESVDFTELQQQGLLTAPETALLEAAKALPGTPR